MPLLTLTTILLVGSALAATPAECPVEGSWALSDATAALSGPAAYDRAGTAMDASGDLTGDGTVDLVVGMPGHDDPASQAGGVVVLLAVPTADAVLGDGAGVPWLGEAADDTAGQAIAVGDLNGDGVAELVVGAPGEDSGGNQAGAAYLVFGPIDAKGLLADGTRLMGEESAHQAGTALAIVSDGDGDGAAELAVGAPGPLDGGKGDGRVYWITDPPRGVVDLGSVDVVIPAPDGTTRFGHALADAGDVDGDGEAELVATSVADGEAAKDVAYVHVYGETALSEVSPVADWTLALTGLPTTASLAVVGLPDQDRDGRDELFVALPPTDDGVDRVTLVRVDPDGVAAGGLTELDVALTVQETRTLASDPLGLAGGDLDGDGFEELLVGAVFGDDADDRVEVAWFLDEPPLGEQTPSEQAAAHVLTSSAARGRVWRIASADFDGDGRDDAALASVSGEGIGPESGVVHLLRSWPCEDLDQDGWTEGEGDCDDQDPERSPGHGEICDDDVDNDCDQQVDERDPDCETGVGDTGGTAPGDTGLAPSDDPDDPRWARCEFRGGGAVFTLVLLPLWRRRSTAASTGLDADHTGDLGAT